MAKTDQELAQEELARQGIDYKYGGDTIMGAFMPTRRQVITPEFNQFIGYDDRGRAMIQTIPAQYGEAETDFSYAPVVRGAKAAGSFLRDVFFGDANEQAQAVSGAYSALRGVGEAVPQMVNEQVRAAASGGRYYDPESNRIVEFDPTIAMVGGAPAGAQAIRAATPNTLTLGSAGGRIRRDLDMSTEARMQRAKDLGFEEDIYYKGMYPYDYTKESGDYAGPEITEINRPTEFPAFNDGEKGVDIAGFLTKDPEVANRFAGSFRGGAVYPLRYRIGKVYTIDANGRNAGELQFGERGQEFRDAVRSGNYDTIEIINTADEGNITISTKPENIRSINAEFDPEKIGSAQILASGSRAGTGVAAGSAIRETFRIGDEGFDPRFDSRAKEQQRILDTELRYESSPIVRPYVSIYDLEGKPFALTMADRTKAGSRLLGVEGVDYDIPVDLQGGQDYMFANPLGREGQVWAQDKGATSMYLNSFMGLGGQPIADEILMLPYRMAPSGGDFATMTAETMLTHARNNMTRRSKAKVDRALKDIYPEWKGIDNPESITQIAMMKGDPRKQILQVMDRDFRNEGGIGIGQARLAVTDRLQYNAPDYTLQNVGAADPYLGRFEQSGHRTYSQGLAGRPIGTLVETDINAMELLPDFVRGRGFGSVDELLAADPETLAREYYTMRRGLRGGTITEDMLRDIERRRSQ